MLNGAQISCIKIITRIVRLVWIFFRLIFVCCRMGSFFWIMNKIIQHRNVRYRCTYVCLNVYESEARIIELSEAMEWANRWQHTYIPCGEITIHLVLQQTEIHPLIISYLLFSYIVLYFLLACRYHNNSVQQCKGRRREGKKRKERRKEKSGFDYADHAVLLLERLVPNTVSGSAMPFNFAVFSFLWESINCLNSSKSPKDISKSNISTSISSEKKIWKEI